MIPFLASPQVIVVNNGAPSPAGDTSAYAEYKPLVTVDSQAVHASVAKALAQAAKSTAKEAAADAAEAAKDAAEEAADAARDAADASRTKAIVIHRSKSQSSDDGTFAVIPIVAIVFTFLYLIVKAVMAPFTQRAAKRGGAAPVADRLSEDEQAILLKLQRTLGQMESRVESLETILIEQHRTKEKYGTKL